MMKELGVAVEKGSKRASQGPDPGRELYFRALGLGKENPEEGLRTYDELLTQYPQHELAGAALSSQGDLYRLMNQYDKAIAKFQRVLEEYPDSRFTGGDPVAPAAAWLIMMSYYSKNDMPNAKKALDFALQKYPDARFGGRLRSESYAKIIKRINEAAAK
jgi:tetratricopeptide (TPR) repeat protein